MKNVKWSVSALAFAGWGMLISCNSPSEEANQPMEGHGVVLANMDTSMAPGDNFYEYANGGWLKNTTIPEDQTRWGAFNELRETNNDEQQKIMKKAAAHPEEYSGDPLKALAFYKIGMDSLKAEEAGTKPLQPYLDKISSMTSKTQLPEVVAGLNKLGVGALFSDYVYVDRKNSEAYAYYFGQGGLSLPDKDYYLNDKDEFKKIRTDYQDYIVKLMQLTGEKEAATKQTAKTVLNIETDLAKVSMDRALTRNPDSTYHKMAFTAFSNDLQQFDLKTYVKDSDVPQADIQEVIITQPGFYQGLNKIIAKYSLNDWKAYLKFQTVNTFADVMSHDFVQANYDFYDAKLNGAQAMRPRWKRMLEEVNSYLGQAFGQIYVKEVFPPEAKENMQVLVKNVRSIFGERIKDLDWMSPETKAKAQEKLDAFNVKIAYPDKWKSYEGLKVDTSSLVQSVINGNLFNHQDNVEKLGKPVDRSEWFMNPQTVNAYYSPTFNEIVFPAAILQPPFYDYQADKAVNYGGIGAVIGHELTHGFDDSGRKYNAVGNQEDWWTAEDAKLFDARAQQVVDQYEGYTVLDSMHLNGRLTLGENIADLGGVTLAYYAMEKDFDENGRPGKIDGLTPEQRFFINWATVWRSKYRAEALRNQVMTDPHSPGEFRAMGPISNLPEFKKAFDLNDNSKMIRPDSLRAVIW